jgi:hypothetical protein
MVGSACVSLFSELCINKVPAVYIYLKEHEKSLIFPDSVLYYFPDSVSTMSLLYISICTDRPLMDRSGKFPIGANQS